ncbi:MAG: hypothetical protein IKN14_00510 [Clostridiales bacterium]|nr:hypothetical protein [Clostridiales bacterium]
MRIKKKSEHSSDFFILLLIILFIMVGIIPIVVMSCNENNRKNQLKELSLEIEECIEDGDYDEANKLNRELNQLAGELSGSDEDKWKEQYNDYKYLIEKTRREDLGIEAQKITMTKSSSDIRKYNREQAERYFEDLGFYYITLVENDPIINIFKKDSISDVSIDGEKSFEVGDVFSDDDEVCIYYYPD